MRKCIAVLLSATTLFAALFVGCSQLQDLLLPTPGVPGEWNTLLREVRVFEQRIGFQETANFKSVYEETGAFPICGSAPRFQLPYSYEDPAIHWSDAQSEQECHAAADGKDVYFTHVEAMGEIGTAVTSTMLEGKLDRFLYLVIHEDCHDQFDLPYGVEEALCNMLGYRGMAAFSLEKYGVKAREDRAVQRYAERQVKLTRAVVGYYQQVEQLYARHARQEIADAALLIERARIFSGAERTFGWKRKAMNNVGLANEMTYSRHYALLENVHEKLGRDLSRTVAFFKHVDKVKPARAALMERLRIAEENSVQFVRGYEEAVVQIIEKALTQHIGEAAAGRLK